MNYKRYRFSGCLALLPERPESSVVRNPETSDLTEGQ